MIQTSLLTFTIRSRIKISPTSTGQKRAVSMKFLTLSSRLATARRDLASNSDKKPKNRRTFAKKNRLKNREIRKNRINLLLFTFKNRRKIKEKSALFGGPYRNPDRQSFYSPLAVRKHAKTRKIADNRRKHHLSNKLATGASPRFRHYGV